MVAMFLPFFFNRAKLNLNYIYALKIFPNFFAYLYRLIWNFYFKVPLKCFTQTIEI